MHTSHTTTNTPPQVLVTGGAKRLGAAICHHLHAAGYDLLIHYHTSKNAAIELAAELEAKRASSVKLFRADLSEMDSVNDLIEQVLSSAQNLTLVVNNASRFYPLPLGEVTVADWEGLMGANLQGAFFLNQGLAPQLAKQQGSIINIADIYAQSPLANHSLYSITKAAVVMMSKALALELAPEVRVNSISPGIILWPENDTDSEHREKMLKNTALGKVGQAADIAAAVLFLAEQADYITGHNLLVDGGRSLYI